MATYTLIENGIVVNMIEWDGAAAVNFGAGITAVEAPAGVMIGYTFDGTNFAAPASQTPVPTQAEVIATYSAALQGVLDSYAQSWGYDSIVSAASYAASTVDKFKNEAAALIGWRDATWSWAESFEAQVEAGTATLPTDVTAFLALMPAQPARPS